MASECFGKVAVKVLQERSNQKEPGSKINVQVLVTSLKECSRTRNLEWGKQVHAEAVQCGHDCNIYVANTLINMYAKCGRMADAREVFDGIKHSTVVSWNALILGYADNGDGNTALVMFSRMTAAPDSKTLVAVFKACISLTAGAILVECSDRGKAIHNISLANGCNPDAYAQSTLLDLYAKCGSMMEAQEVFDSMSHPDVLCWTVLILGYAGNGKGDIGLELFMRMRNDGPAPDYVTLVAAIKACTSLAGSSQKECRERGKELHIFAMENGYSDVYLQSTLVDMYAKCGSMVDACEVFNGMKHRTVVSWNVLIMGYVDNGQCYIALDMFTRMSMEGPAPDSLTVVAALKACCSLERETSLWGECRDRGTQIYNIAVEKGCNSDLRVQRALLNMYTKCSIVEARDVLDAMKHPDVVSYTTLILAYTDTGQSYSALDLLAWMKIKGPDPDSRTLVASLKACTALIVTEGAIRCRNRGREIQKLAKENGYVSDVYVQSTLVDLYAKCGSMTDAREVFDSMNQSTVVSWNVLLLGYVENGDGYSALDMFKSMSKEGPAPDSMTFVAAVKACTCLAVKEGAGHWAECRDKGKAVHSIVVENGCSSEDHVESALIDLYSKCGSMLDSQKVFNSIKHPDIVSWNVLMLGYAENGEGDTALDLFSTMNIEGQAPDDLTVVAALKACTSLAAKNGVNRWAERRDVCKEIQSFAVEHGCNSVCVRNSLLDTYAKCGNMVDAQEIFDGLKHPTVVSWNALLLGYAENGQGHTAVNLFKRMKTDGPAPDSVTFGIMLKACGLVGALEFGRRIHSELDSWNVIDVVLLTCLVDFYAKCGSLLEAQSVFNMHAETRNIVTWNALLAGYSSCGKSEVVFDLFQGMQDSGFKPDGITFLCILSCCSHAGLVVKGKKLFEAMSTKYSVVPAVEHYSCMIDMFGRANKIDDAMVFLERMPYHPNDVTWRTILGASRKWENAEMGKIALKSLQE